MFPEINDGIAKTAKLPRWSSTKPTQADLTARKSQETNGGSEHVNGERGPIKFAYDPSINKRIIYW